MLKKVILCLLLTLVNSFSNVKETTSLIPGGENIAIEIKPKGVVVIGGYDINIDKYKYNPTIDSDIKKGDLIYQVEDDAIDNINDMLSMLKKYNSKDSVCLTILRNNKDIKRNLKLVKTSKANTIKTGLLVKERILGIGTMTFYDPETKIYGALGHKLIDNDFTNIADINTGTLLASKVNGINKSTVGNVGEILASVYENQELGTVFANTDYGIFGYYDTCPDKEALIMASHEQIKLGNANILTTLDDSGIKSYTIEITSLAKQNSISTKGISFKITDKDLISKTGGIVQGMSGSPIIQDGKIIGAVTHVLVDSVKKGYGIYIDYMFQAAFSG